MILRVHLPQISRTDHHGDRCPHCRPCRRARRGPVRSQPRPDAVAASTIINALLSADADAVVGAEYGRPSTTRAAQRNGYRHRDLLMT
nr:transposase [Lapillicoccus jejuensis]